MPSTEPLANEINLVKALEILVQTYEEVYVMRMQKAREGVLASRSFMEGLLETFSEVKWAYQRKLIQEGKKASQVSQLWKQPKPKQLVAVLLTAKRRLSTELDQQVFDAFWQFTLKQPQADLIIVGDIGKQLFDFHNRNQRNYTYIELSQAQLQTAELWRIINLIIDYEHVYIFYPRFINILRQEQATANLSGDQPLQASAPPGQTPGLTFLFEPKVEELKFFFESQMLGTLFKQTGEESYLAQLGSRIQGLETAVHKIDDRLKQLDYQFRKSLKIQKNKKQLQTLTSISFWKPS
jgi:F0F1-type ATP synthase gamma subunit